MLEFNQGDVNYIVSQCAISEQVLSHPQQSKFTKPTSGGCETSRACVLYDIYLGKLWQTAHLKWRMWRGSSPVNNAIRQPGRISAEMQQPPNIFRRNVAGRLSKKRTTPPNPSKCHIWSRFQGLSHSWVWEPHNVVLHHKGNSPPKETRAANLASWNACGAPQTRQDMLFLSYETFPRRFPRKYQPGFREKVKMASSWSLNYQTKRISA